MPTKIRQAWALSAELARSWSAQCEVSAKQLSARSSARRPANSDLDQLTLAYLYYCSDIPEIRWGSAAPTPANHCRPSRSG